MPVLGTRSNRSDAEPDTGCGLPGTIMKISFCTIAFQKNKWGRDRVVERAVGEVLPILAEAGYDGAELWGPHVGAMSPAELDALRRQLDELHLATAMVSPYFDFTSSDQSAADSLVEALWFLQFARRLGSRAVRVFTGKTGSATATEEQWTRAARCLRTLADASAADGIIWALETHANNLMDTVEGTLRLLRLVGRPNVRLIFQPSTFRDEYVRATEALAPYACHVHGNHYGGGEIDFRKVLGRLKSVGFHGFVSVEWMGEDPESAARDEARALRELIG